MVIVKGVCRVIPGESTISSEAGTGILVNQDIAPGEPILQIHEPFLRVLDSPRLMDTCENCIYNLTNEFGERRAIDLSKCGGCGVVRYCSEKCQKTSWKHHHKYECKIFKSLHPRVLPNTVRLTMQFFLRLKARLIEKSDLQIFLGLEDHLEHFQKLPSSAPNSFENIQLMAQAVKEYSKGSEPLVAIQKMLCLIIVNTLTLTTPVLDTLGLVIDPLLSLINHSCNPNTAITFNGSTSSVRSLRAIPSGTEITVSYIDNTFSRKTRILELQSRYFFNCTCQDCKNGTTVGKASISPPQDLENLLQSLPDNQTGLEMGLKACVTANYPPHAQPYAALRDRYILTLIGEKNFKRAFQHALVRYFFIDSVHYPTTFHPVRVVRLMTLHRLIGVFMSNDHRGGWGPDTDWKKEGWDYRNWPSVFISFMMEYKEGLRKSHGEETGIWDNLQAFEKRISREMPEGGFTKAEQRKAELWAKLRRIAEKWKDVVCYSPEIEEQAKKEGRAASLPESEVVMEPPKRQV